MSVALLYPSYGGVPQVDVLARLGNYVGKTVESGNKDVLLSTAQATGTWIEGHTDLLEGLQALRRLGPGSESVIGAVLAVRDLRRTRLWFEIFETLAEDSDAYPAALLSETVSWSLVRTFRAAIYGQDRDPASVPPADTR